MPKLYVMETIRDERLGIALTLLQRSKTTRPGYMPLLAGCAFIGAATFLAYVVTKSTVFAMPVVIAAKAPQASPNATDNKADFELSVAQGSTVSEPPVTEVVILGTEQSR